MNVEEQWKIILESLHRTIDRNVPRRRFDWEGHSVPLNNQNKADIQKKHRMWSRYIETRDDGKKQKYNRL